MLVCVGACVPELEVDESVIDAPVPLGWRRCLVPPTLDEAGTVRAECLSFDAASEVRETIAFAPAVEATVPFDVCRRFGPDPRVLEDGSTARPASPDATGGYAQPIVVELPEAATLDFSFFEHRIRCNLAGVRQDVAVAFRRQYRANAPPEPTTLRLRTRGDRRRRARGGAGRGRRAGRRVARVPRRTVVWRRGVSAPRRRRDLPDGL